MTNIKAIMAELKEYTVMQDELTAQIETLKDEVKAYMKEHGIDEVIGDEGEKATWREVTSKRTDMTALKRDLGDALDEYIKLTKCMRFTFNK